MTIQFSNYSPEFVATRRFLHQNPELGLSEFKTSDFLAEQLLGLGYEVTRGLGQTGLVARLTQGGSGRSIGIRADVDALPIQEETGLDHASRTAGLMHACGHDGHTAMLLGAARILAERRMFDGTVNLIFQPAEENFAGARLMIEDGLFRRFPCDAVFGLHNDPSIPFGTIAVREGAIMAAADECRIIVNGRGGHGAEPQDASDPIVCGASIVMALQTIVSRNLHALDQAVITVGAFNAGKASNVIPERAEMAVTVRSFDPAVRDMLERRIRALAQGQAESFGMTVSIDYERGYEPTINHKRETDLVRDVAARVVGAEKLVELARPSMGSEDFAFMLKECPGSYFLLGTAKTENDPPLHHPRFDFNDEALPIGVAMWVELVETFLNAPPETGRSGQAERV
ncbi:M20 aminoacylase family protein [Rhizobium sp. SSA_523]|uniref:M20 aminoacylase family protein n=1 Tax=Rhizobium sp. SSA_523 TaxID=2952477 RepID=UPI002090B941|nr:M20 aminoacylase family protein [Rhizobium sp. SSA_523]MCO5734525.1 M20 family metallopeptidase [Rhizobium sp. SSA_523]WKC23233.1 M20 aminoacylase family protein [Rhizobium sp. SSA_523]